jgi:hypothetical protein
MTAEQTIIVWREAIYEVLLCVAPELRAQVLAGVGDKQAAATVRREQIAAGDVLPAGITLQDMKAEADRENEEWDAGEDDDLPPPRDARIFQAHHCAGAHQDDRKPPFVRPGRRHPVPSAPRARARNRFGLVAGLPRQSGRDHNRSSQMCRPRKRPPVMKPIPESPLRYPNSSGAAAEQNLLLRSASFRTSGVVAEHAIYSSPAAEQQRSNPASRAYPTSPALRRCSASRLTAPAGAAAHADHHPRGLSHDR